MDVTAAFSLGDTSGKGETTDPTDSTGLSPPSLCMDTLGHKPLRKRKVQPLGAFCPVHGELAALISARVRLSHSMLASDLATASDLTIKARGKIQRGGSLWQKLTMPDR